MMPWPPAANIRTWRNRLASSSGGSGSSEIGIIAWEPVGESRSESASTYGRIRLKPVGVGVQFLATEATQNHPDAVGGVRTVSECGSCSPAYPAYLKYPNNAF